MLTAAAPFRQFIVKLHSRCNLSCTYCYVYHHVDDSWRGRPNVISDETVAALADRIGDHVRRHDLPRIVVVLHGGEPLLAGPDVLDRVITALRAAVPGSTDVEVTIQTNGTLLDQRFLEIFHRHEVGVGVSLDGGGPIENRRRVYADGRESFHLVEQALERLGRPEHADVFTGVLCTIDLDNDPIEVYEGLLAFRPPQIDLLLPLGNWVHRPPQRGPNPGLTPYSDWLITVFDRWFDAPRRETRVRLFDSLISLLVGGASDTEAVGLSSANAITIETDGSMEVTDALKTTAPGLGATGLNVRQHSFEDAMRHPKVRAVRRERGNLAEKCLSCPVVDICGGGHFSHRYSHDGSFAHPSVYCADLFQLIGHIRGRLLAELAARRALRAGRDDTWTSTF